MIEDIYSLFGRENEIICVKLHLGVLLWLAWDVVVGVRDGLLWCRPLISGSLVEGVLHSLNTYWRKSD